MIVDEIERDDGLARIHLDRRRARLPEGHPDRQGRADAEDDRLGRAGADRAVAGGRVFLDLRVKVMKEWQRDPKALDRLGYWPPLLGAVERADHVEGAQREPQLREVAVVARLLPVSCSTRLSRYASVCLWIISRVAAASVRRSCSSHAARGQARSAVAGRPR